MPTPLLSAEIVMKYLSRDHGGRASVNEPQSQGLLMGSFQAQNRTGLQHQAQYIRLLMLEILEYAYINEFMGKYLSHLVSRYL